MRTQGIVLALCLACSGCGASGYRVVSSDQHVQLGAALSLSAVAHAGAEGDQTGFDTSLARALEDATPDHRMEADAAYSVHVEVRELRREGEQTVANSTVSIRGRDGRTVDQLEVAFEVTTDEAGAGAELGRRIGHFVTHRGDHHI